MAELKYKVGDKLRIVDRKCIHNFNIGEEVTVVVVDDTDEQYPYRVHNGEYTIWVSEVELGETELDVDWKQIADELAEKLEAVKTHLDYHIEYGGGIGGETKLITEISSSLETYKNAKQ